jgi:uncharacterized membrane protein HdeD (DUF308 family)
MTTIRVETYGVVDEGEPGGRWAFWLLLVLGIGWILLSFLLLQFSYSSITALTVLVGIVLLVASASEIAVAFIAEGWRWAHVTLGVLFGLGGIAAFVYPGQTFGTLALFFGWYLLLKGTIDVVDAFVMRGAHLWWFGLVAGIAEIALAFWAVGYPGRSAALLILWVGIGAMIRGVVTLTAAFQIRSITRGTA